MEATSHNIFRIALLALTLVTSSAFSQNFEEVIHYHNDALGSPIAATDQNGDALWSENYAPYGSRLNNESRETDCTSGSCVPVETTRDEKQWFTGKFEETRLGVQYFGARWYSAETGRFLSRDPVAFNVDNIYSFNSYAYGNNNPYLYVDPDGRYVESAWDIFNISLGLASFSSNRSSGNYGAAAVDLAGVVLDVVALATPLPAAAGTAIRASRTSDIVAEVAKGVGKADNAPDFVVSPGGTAFPVPKGANGPTPVVNPAGKKTGDAFTGGSGGANGQVDTMRMMDPTPPRGNSPGYPNGYIKYENKAGQGVDPYTGRTLSNKDSHFPID